MTVAESVRAKVAPNCITKRCRKGKCSISIQGMSGESFAIDMDHPKAPVGRYETRCDYLFLGSTNASGNQWVAPLELKEGDVRASEVVQQLQAGADVADRLVPASPQVNFRPVVASGRIHKGERAKLRENSNKVRFRGERKVVRRMRCGERLDAELRKP